MLDIRQTNSDGDIDLSGGDLEWIEPTEQHQRDLLIAAPGFYKEAPTVGVDSTRTLLDNDTAVYLRRIRKQFTKDGMRVQSLDYQNEELTIEAEYESSNG